MKFDDCPIPAEPGQFEVTFTYNYGGITAYDVVTFALVPVLGNTLSATAARDYIFENKDVCARFFYTEAYFPDSPTVSTDVDGRYCIVFMPLEYTLMRTIDACYAHNGQMTNIKRVANTVAFNDPDPIAGVPYDVITTGIQFENILTGPMTELANGGILDDHQWSKTSAFSPSHAGYPRGYIGQTEINGIVQQIQIGPDMGAMKVFQGAYNSGIDPLSTEQVNGFREHKFYLDHPEEWTNGFTSQYKAALYGLTHLSMQIYRPMSATYIGIIEEPITAGETESKKMLFVAMSKLTGGFINHQFAQGYAQGLEFLTALQASGKRDENGMPIDFPIYNMDGGATGAMALRCNDRFWYPTKAIRHSEFRQWMLDYKLNYVNNYMGFRVDFGSAE